MKKAGLLLSLFFLLFVSCAQSNEDRAKEMAANYLKGVLYHYDSYEPIITTIDSMFISITSDEKAISKTIELVKSFESAEQCVKKLQGAERIMDLWQPTGYSSAYSKGQYKRAKEEKEQQEKILEKLKDRIKTQFYEIKQIQESLKTGEFSGWKVYQKFKSLNGTGSMDLFGEYIFLCDKDFENCHGYEKDEFDVMTKLMQAIGDSDEISDLEDNLINLL